MFFANVSQEYIRKITSKWAIAGVASERGPLLFGVTLGLLAVYQLSPYKHRCLKYCRTSLGFLMESHEPGVRGVARTCFRFAVLRVGCCWALFAVMVVGSMNLLWMAVLTVFSPWNAWWAGGTDWRGASASPPASGAVPSCSTR